MEQKELQILLRLFKALANENRLKILGILANQECSVEELATLLNIKEPTTSHHLAKLKEVGLATMYSEGNTHFYQLNLERLTAINKDLFSPAQIESLADDLVYDAWEQKVLHSFFQEGRLQQIPASRKKRLVVLKWLVSQFEMDHQYTEAEVNEIITRYHPDYATLRREFIINKLMARDKNIYWRLPLD